MENEIFERDYADEFRKRSEGHQGADFLDALKESGFWQAYKEEMDKIHGHADHGSVFLRADTFRGSSFSAASFIPLCGAKQGTGV